MIDISSILFETILVALVILVSYMYYNRYRATNKRLDIQEETILRLTDSTSKMEVELKRVARHMESVEQINKTKIGIISLKFGIFAHKIENLEREYIAVGSPPYDVETGNSEAGTQFIMPSVLVPSPESMARTSETELSNQRESFHRVELRSPISIALPPLPTISLSRIPL